MTRLAISTELRSNVAQIEARSQKPDMEYDSTPPVNE